MDNIVTEPQGRVSQLSMLSAAKRQQLLYEWNDTTVDYPEHLCVHQLFEQQVEKTPDAIALVYDQQQLTYRQLNQKSNQLAHHLQSLGVGPDVIVGLCIERSIDMVVGLLGILKAGGAYLPLDPSYPQERLSFMLEDAQAPFLLTQELLADDLPSSWAQLLLLEDLVENLSTLSTYTPNCAAAPKTLAYIIYTSGSTGIPKGVMIEHRGVVNYLCWCTQEYAIAQASGAPVHSSLSFDATITALFAPLIVGKRVILLPEEQSALTVLAR
jgi:non-ribosomal peptide synthetase component F